MADLKLDLLNKINNDKYFEELELVRLAQDPNMNYKEKVDSMSNRLASIAVYNAQLGLVEQYFKTPAPAPAANVPQGAPAGAPQGGGIVHPGQTFGE
jgi:hypothetical protein